MVMQLQLRVKLTRAERGAAVEARGPEPLPDVIRHGPGSAVHHVKRWAKCNQSINITLICSGVWAARVHANALGYTLVYTQQLSSLR